MPWLIAVVIGAMATSLGCDGRRAVYPVTGAVSFKGQPVPKGTIAFAGDNETTFIAGGDIIDGRYSVDVAAGTYRITIDTPEPPRMPGPPPPGLNIPPEVIKKLTEEARAAASEKRVLVPKRYGQYDTSPLRFTATKGQQTHDVNITEE
jgi:hypothetical protein